MRFPPLNHLPPLYNTLRQKASKNAVLCTPLSHTALVRKNHLPFSIIYVTI